MPKNIVLLLDGTSNEIKKNRSNILRLYGTLEKNDQQLVYYDPGVGTFGADGAWSRFWRKAVEVWGMATGWGLDQNVKEAYRFLIENYDNGKRDGDDVAPDRIFIFGFSRGAYTARVLAGFIHAFGLVERRSLNLLDYAYRAYKKMDASKEGSFDEIKLHQRIVQPQFVPIHCLGLFDTVSSVIETVGYLPRLKKHMHTVENTSVLCIRHAVAMDECRTMFRPQLWPEGVSFLKGHNADDVVTQDVREVWFAGVHGDVGGGYPEANAGLAKIPLKWMIDQTASEGLYYKTDTVNELVLGQRKDRDYVPPNIMAAINISMTPIWKLLEFLPRMKPEGSVRPSFAGFVIPFFEARNVPENARIHSSVLERNQTKGTPKNMPSVFRTES